MLAGSACTASICGTHGRLDIGGTFYLPSWVRLHDRDGDVIDRHDPVADVAHQGLRYQAAEAIRGCAAVLGSVLVLLERPFDQAALADWCDESFERAIGKAVLLGAP